MADSAPLNVTISHPAGFTNPDGSITPNPYWSNPKNVNTDSGEFGAGQGDPQGKDFSSDLGLTASADESSTGSSKDAAVTNGKDISNDLGLLSPKSTNDQIFANLGYSKDDITKVKDDPIYKLAVATDGDNFLAKEIQTPGSLMETMRKVPGIGAFLHEGDMSQLGVAQLLAHGAHAMGVAPATTPMLMDAFAKLNEQEFQQSTGITKDEYTIPKILGAVAAAGGPTLVAGMGRAVTQATLASASANGLARRLLQGAGGVLTTAATGAAGSAALTPTTDVPSTSGPAASEAFWKQKGDDAQSGALWALTLHGALKTMFKAGGYLNKGQAVSEIKKTLMRVRSVGPMGSQDYKDVMDKFTDLFSKPEYAEREMAFAQHGIDPTLGDVSHGPVSKTLEKTSTSMPLGLSDTRKDQGKQVVKAAENYAAKIYDGMINAKFENMDELEKAAASGGAKSEAAKKILEEMKNAHLSPAQVMKLSSQGNGIRKWLIKQKLFAARDALAGDAAIDTSSITPLAQRLIAANSKGANPNKEVLAVLGRNSQYFSDPATDKGYAAIESTIRGLDGDINKLGDQAGPLIDLKRALVKAQADFTDNVTKYAKSERFGITAANTKPFFKTGKGDGYSFDALRPQGAAEMEPGVRAYKDAGAAATAGEKGPFESKTVKLRSPVIVEGPNGLAAFKTKLGLPDSATDAEVTKAAVDYAKAQGHDGVVFTWNGTPRQIVDMVPWKRAIGDAQNKAQKFFKDNLGTLERTTDDAIAQSNADNLLDKAINKKGVESATAYFKSFDAKGQAALRAAAIERSIKSATNPDGTVSPEKIARYLHDRRDALGVFFKGEDRWALNGFINLMDEAKNAGGHGGGHGLTGTIMMAEALMEIVKSGTPGEAMVGAAKTFIGLGALGYATKKFATNPTLRAYLLAADSLKPGSPAMKKLLDKFMTTADLAAGSAAGQTRGGLQ